MFCEVLCRLFDFMDSIEKVRKQQKASDVLKVGKILFYKVVRQGLDLFSQWSKVVVDVSAKVVTTIITMKKHYNFKPMMYEWADMAIRVPNYKNDRFSYPFARVKPQEKTNALLFY